MQLRQIHSETTTRSPSKRTSAPRQTRLSPVSKAALQGLATVTPSRFYSQAQLVDLLGYEGNAVAERMFLQNGMDGRFMALQPEEFARTSEPGFQQGRFQVASIDLALKATERLFKTTGIAPSRIGSVIGMTTYGFVVPSITAHLIERFNLNDDVTKLDLNGSGCCGSVSLLSAAQAQLALEPNKLVLAVTSEVGSQFMRRWPGTDKRRMVINALMGDAAVAMLIGNAGSASATLPELVDTEYCSDPTTLDRVVIRLADDGTMDGHIDREVPAIASRLYPIALERLLERNGLERRDVDHWVLHPGSRGVIDALQTALELSDAQVAASRATLQRYGNVASATALCCLDETVQRSMIHSGEIGILGGIGPGMTVGLTLLRWA